jgi:exopolysaccharide biosynthesis polyprenyl glycosylphosphotransferase
MITRTISLNRVEDAPNTQMDHMPEQVSGFSVSEYFHQVLYLERKRRERSQRPMYLLLIDVMRLAEHEQDAAISALSSLLACMTRETDTKGWYSEGNVIGVLFTEINTFDKQKIVKKIKNALELRVPPGQVGKLIFTIHAYPQERDDSQNYPPVNPLLYPEVKKKYDARKGPFLVKRVIDIIGSIVGLILFSPVFLIIALLVKFTSPGPVLFRQKRLGLYGKQFTFLKFRTMQVNNDPSVHEEYIKKLIAGTVDDGTDGGNGGNGHKPVFKITNDTRVTTVGRILRKTSLDELPQFLNVLLGDMSLVGPRPPIPYEVENYDIWHRCRVVEVKPGITGLWQVMGRSTTSFDEMVRLDIRYLREWNIWMDLKILAMTPWAVLKGKGAY